MLFWLVLKLEISVVVTDKINYYLPHMCTLNPNHRDHIFRAQWRRDESLPLNYFPALFFGLKCSPGFTLSHELEHPGKIGASSSSGMAQGFALHKEHPSFCPSSWDKCKKPEEKYTKKIGGVFKKQNTCSTKGGERGGHSKFFFKHSPKQPKEGKKEKTLANMASDYPKTIQNRTQSVLVGFFFFFPHNHRAGIFY